MFDLAILQKRLKHRNYVYGMDSKNEFCIGDSSCAIFVPIYAYSNSDSFNVASNLLYYKPEAAAFRYGISGYSELFNKLESADDYYTYRFKYQDVEHRIGICRGIVYDLERNRVLLALGLKNSEFFYQDYFDPKDFKLYIATEFATDEKYKTLYNKILKEYITPAMSNGVQVSYALSRIIEETLYANNFKLKFNTITQLQEHLNTSVSRLLALPMPRIEEPSTAETEYEDLPF